MPLRTLESVGDLRSRTVLLRASLNVPLAADGSVRNRYRLDQALPTLRFLQAAGAKTVVVGHIGRAADATLRPVADALGNDIPVMWGGPVTADDFPSRVASMADGDILIAENIRQDPREKANDPEFSRYLASLVEVYVNDAFAAMHRTHASLAGVPEHIPAYAGLRVEAEIASLAAAMEPTAPSLFMLGGAKFDTKFALVEKYLAIYDTVFIGGALANDMLRARGLEIGRSLVSDVDVSAASFLWDERLLLPSDVVVERVDGTRATVAADAVTPTDIIYDCGPETVEMLRTHVDAAATVLWNGPFGNYETGYNVATEAIAAALADSAASSYVGGGDTVAAIEALGRADDFTFVSTGGGAMLTYLEHGTLPTLPYLIAAE